MGVDISSWLNPSAAAANQVAGGSAFQSSLRRERKRKRFQEERPMEDFMEAAIRSMRDNKNANQGGFGRQQAFGSPAPVTLLGGL